MMLEIDDGYSIPYREFLLRPLTWSEKVHLRELIEARRVQIAEQFLLRRGRVNDLNGEPVEIVDPDLQQEVSEILIGWQTEAGDMKNLRQSALLMMKHPLLGIRSCQLCKTWWFDEDTRKIVNIGGVNARRPAHAAVACDTDAGCLKGHWSNPVELSDKNKKAWEHWLEWRSVGCPRPYDAIMRRNWKWLEAMAKRYGLGKNRRTSRD